MPYDEGLAQRIREAFEERSDISEKRMFGGIVFLLHGNMCCGVVRSELMVRVGPDGYDDALTQPHAREMDFTGKPMRGMIYLSAEGIEADADLEQWLARGVAFSSALPAK